MLEAVLTFNIKNNYLIVIRAGRNFLRNKQDFYTQILILSYPYAFYCVFLNNKIKNKKLSVFVNAYTNIERQLANFF